MKVTSFELFLVPPRWMFLRIDTDQGISGWGEPILEGHAESVRAAVEVLCDGLVGEDPTRIEDHWQVMTKGGFYRGGPVLASAVAGIDQALWDIKGKSLGVPVYELLGGPVRERVRMYTWLHGADPTALAADADEKAAAGFTAVKFAPAALLPAIPTAREVREIAASVGAVRQAVGDDVDICIDVHGRFTTAAAKRVLPWLEEYLPMFVEEPVLPEHVRNVSQVAESTSIPLALGERLYSRWDFDEVLRSGVRVAQPDLSHAGGISEVRRIAAMAETHDVVLAPHCPLGPIALAACVQVDVATPNFLIQEQSLGIGYHAEVDWKRYVSNSEVFELSGGSLRRPVGPGLGLVIDEDAVREAAFDGHGWRNPLQRHADGSHAEW
ncbi:galactonate dehydratase [Nostocoides sp. HKS02]|uniref:galactonate dehydratase n=1 Tax=Nostocoides sp. HKS02 TaxID=1813880 RepID=UPI0012B4AD16|nr:galactonate dehydratase [Tetrasphaera sp. HKS02]QGN59094.1 galactonate dehydratase [Tetrasphaera sp. HKS02]